MKTHPHGLLSFAQIAQNNQNLITLYSKLKLTIFILFYKSPPKACCKCRLIECTQIRV